MRKAIISILVCLQLTSCSISSYYRYGTDKKRIRGTEFYNMVKDSSWQAREEIVLKLFTEGYTPYRSRLYLPIRFNFFDSSQGKYLHVKYFVTSDYLSIGTNNDFMRIPMTPILAQKIADRFYCFLPTRKIVNDIYEQASVKLEPFPLTEARDSFKTFYIHHLLIERERKGRGGIIAGIKKDIVITDKINSGPKTNKIAIYGWHKLDANPIQPLYTGHVNWYVDYSHGVRLVSKTIYIDEKKYDYTEILKNKNLRKILTDEDTNEFIRYPEHF
jgi:hypothetical protein